MKWQKPPANNPGNSNRQILKYAGMASQLLVMTGLAVLAGYYGDKRLHSFPMFTCAIPLLALVVFFYKIIRETGRGEKNRN